ncbi:MAG: hypothetical protein QNJ29_08370 [Rhizobiaceae bacterium]|nr:hypothetical protein [Rhizobiaceae bacterium]
MTFSRSRNKLQKKQKQDAQEGFALIVVLLFLLVATAIITPMVLAARTDFLLSSRTYLNTRQSAMSEGILNIIAREIALQGVEKNEALLFDSTPMQTGCGDYRITVSVQDQSGTIDLNAAPEELLEEGFKALGIATSDSQRLARLVVAYRSPKESTGIEPSGVGDLVAGLKYFAFEAVEELYEFPGLSKMPPELISQVFTTYSRRATVTSQNMSALLSEVLPDRPTGQYPFIVEAEEPVLFSEIRVLVENSQFDARGFSGAIIETPDPNSGIFNVKERTNDPGILGGKRSFDANMNCAELFGDEVAAIISGS